MKLVFKRASPLVQMTMALVALCSTLVLLGSLFLGTMPDRQTQQQAVRKVVSEALAVQIAEMLRREDAATIEQSLAAIVARTTDLRSVGVRRADGTLIVQTPTHATRWQATFDNDRSRPGQVSVPLHAQGQRWGRFEAAFAEDDTHPVLAFVREPLVQMLFFVAVAGWIVFGLYMRRALQHLDPSSVVPERVQGAFDAMAEGVVVLDARARVMLANKSFRALHPQLAGLRPGASLSTLPWLAEALPDDPMAHPWMRAMNERVPNAGTTLDAGSGDDSRHLVINAAPIADPGGSVRGCMVTFDDLSALHRANASLREALSALETSKAEVEAKNHELERLATRDALTGALNRRAFHAALDALWRDSIARGTALACVMVDIDHFKAINDTHGHGIGDRVIQEVARKLQEAARATDLVCRWGGEEFCVVVPGLNTREVAAFAERLRARIERECGAGVREIEGLRVTASLGVELRNAKTISAAALIDAADQALYRAKRNGRNRVALFAAQSGANAQASPEMPRDAATGALKAAGFDAALQALRGAARGDDRMLGCLVLGLDRGGDAATALAAVVRDELPPDAVFGLVDERRLAIALPGRGLIDCEALAHRLHALSRDAGLEPSVGFDALPATAPGAATLIERAEQAMQRARRQGSSRVARFGADRSGDVAGGAP